MDVRKLMCRLGGRQEDKGGATLLSRRAPTLSMSKVVVVVEALVSFFFFFFGDRLIILSLLRSFRVLYLQTLLPRDHFFPELTCVNRSYDEVYVKPKTFIT